METNIEYRAIKLETITLSFTDERINPLVLKVRTLSSESLEKLMFVIQDNFDIVKSGNKEIL